jgi:hypothetical protein
MNIAYFFKLSSFAQIAATTLLSTRKKGLFNTSIVEAARYSGFGVGEGAGNTDAVGEGGASVCDMVGVQVFAGDGKGE